MGTFDDLEIHYAIEDLEDLKDTVVQLQTMLEAAESNPMAMPMIMEAIHAVLMLAVQRLTERLRIREAEIDRLVEDGYDRA